MKPVAFDDLVRLPVVRLYGAAFRKATGVALRLVCAECDRNPSEVRPCGNDFCNSVRSVPAGCAACYEVEGSLGSRVARKLTTQQTCCYAGLTVVAAPVVVGTRHIATLMSGQIFRREPTERDFLMVLRMLGGTHSSDWVNKTRKAYFETPVLTAERFQAALQLLEVFAQYLADVASRLTTTCAETDPQAVTSAKQFVQAHAEEAITLNQVAAHVHVNRFSFCKLFKKATGLTFTEYVTRVRIEKAKALLRDPSRRISEVVFASGFGSIPRFNTVFKNHVGMPASEYRITLRSSLPH
jgi:AraC-like DNA-binding protein